MGFLERHQVATVGEGNETLLFSHGFGCNQGMFRHLVDHFRADYRIVLYDLAGAGNYPIEYFNKENYRTLDGYARDLIELCDTLHLRNVHFVGHSVSAMIGVLASLERPEQFASLTLIGPSPRYINDGDYYGGFSERDIEELLATMSDNYLGWSSAMAPAIMGNAERPGLGEELSNNFCKTNPEAARHFATVTFTSDNRAELSRVTHPTLVIQCTEDIIASEQVGEYVHRQIPASRYALIRARGHCPNLSAPEPTSAAIREFLAQLSAPA